MRTCSVEGCNRKRRELIYCHTHYEQFRKHGKITKVIRICDGSQGCKIKSCNGEHYSLGYCKPCYNQLPERKEKDRKRVRKWIKENPDYGKQWREKNLEKEREKTRRWNKENPEKVLKTQIRYLKKLGDKFNMNQYQIKTALMSWSKTIRKRDNDKCIICGSKEGLNAHHTLYKRYYPELSLNINNGVTLCKIHHNEVHGKKLKFINI